MDSLVLIELKPYLKDGEVCHGVNLSPSGYEVVDITIPTPVSYQPITLSELVCKFQVTDEHPYVFEDAKVVKTAKSTKKKDKED